MSLVPLLASRPSLLTGGILFDDEAEADKPEANPYRAAAGLSTLELVDYLLDMQEKPRTIRHRPGFAEAVSAAADRLLGAEASDKAQQIAAEVKVEILHEVASLGRKTADAELQAFVLAMKDDQREAIQQLVRFLDHEQRMLAIDDVPLDDVTGQLDSVQKYLTAEKLAARHLRLASATVHGINRLEDNEQREKYFQSFGALFAKSTDKTLSAYGRKIAKAPGTSDSKLVGNDLELSGLTELGVEIDWKAYRGKVVLVDFWATWCGPCIREMPHVRELHEKLGKQGFVVLGVNLDRKPEALAEFLKENKLPWSNLVDEGAQQAATKYGVRAIPTMMVINQQGKIAAVGHRVGGLKATIEKLLAEGKQK
jgi:thiol-disulfide isomerase/thioredoxin